MHAGLGARLAGAGVLQNITGELKKPLSIARSCPVSLASVSQAAADPEAFKALGRKGQALAREPFGGHEVGVSLRASLC